MLKVQEVDFHKESEARFCSKRHIFKMRYAVNVFPIGVFSLCCSPSASD